MCHSYHFLYGIDVTVFRYFTVYGPAGRPDMVMFRFTQWISEGQPLRLNGDGEQSRGFTYVDDIARGTILGLKPLGYEIINLGGHETDHDQRADPRPGRADRQEGGHRAPARQSRPTCWRTGPTLKRPRTCWAGSRRVSLLEGVARLVEWYNAERDWARLVDTG